MKTEFYKLETGFQEPRESRIFRNCIEWEIWIHNLYAIKHPVTTDSDPSI